MSEIKLKYIMLRLAYPEFFCDEQFIDEELVDALEGHYVQYEAQTKTLDRIWRIKGKDFDAEIMDMGNSWSLLVNLLDKRGRKLWNWSRK